MHEQHRRRRLIAGFAALAAAALATFAATARTGSAEAVSYMQPAGAPSIELGPLSAYRKTAAPSCTVPGVGTFNCYTPQNIQAAYDYPSGHKAPTGAGQTIVIVDAYVTDYEAVTGVSLDDDLASFDATFGLPAPPGGLTVDAGPSSGCTGPPDCSGQPDLWAGEISLDVEYAHAMAPGARIVLVSGASDSNADINAAEAEWLPQYPGAIVSQSFGSDEAGANGDLPDEAAMHQIFENAIANGDTILASAGDFGASDGDPYIMASYPASDPLVLAIGGTEGAPYPNGLFDPRGNGRYGAEQVWNETVIGAATGGAPSVEWGAPPWQVGLTSFSSGSNPARTVPDVSYNAAVEGGVLTVEGGNVFITGGTSAGSPQWAAIVALADQARGSQGGLGVVAQPLYALAADPHAYRRDFHDITSGNNALGSGNQPPPSGSLGFSATTGYDLATGLGTPDVSNLISDLANAPRGQIGTAANGPKGGGGQGHGHSTPGN